MQLTNNLYYYPWQGVGNNCNSYLIAGEVVTLIDPGHFTNEYDEPCLEMLIAGLEEDGFQLSDINLVIMTHLHPDHGEAAPVIKAAGTARIAYHETDEPHLSKIRSWYKNPLAPEEPYELKPDFYLQEGDFTLGLLQKAELMILHTPGHSPGSICIYWPAEKALFTGDVVFAASIGRTDLPDGNDRLLKQSITRLQNFEAEYLLPGHMNIVQGNDKIKQNYQFVLQNYFGF